MDEVRIKDLASASGQLAEFDAFEFIVDVPTAAASMKVSGKEIKGVMAPKKHTHAVSDITGLSGELDKKLDKKGGSISGDLSVMGDTYLRRLHLEEFLEVPEYRYNRIETIVGDRWSAPGGGIVEVVSSEKRTLVVKLEDGEISTLRENDLCMGIFLNSAMDASSGNTVNSDDSFGNRTYAGFTTCYFRLTECLDRDTYAEWRYELREGYPTTRRRRCSSWHSAIRPTKSDKHPATKPVPTCGSSRVWTTGRSARRTSQRSSATCRISRRTVWI